MKVLTNKFLPLWNLVRWKFWGRKDSPFEHKNFNELREQLWTVTKATISKATLYNNIHQKINSGERELNLSTDVLNILAKYAGFNDWRQYQYFSGIWGGEELWALLYNQEETREGAQADPQFFRHFLNRSNETNTTVSFIALYFHLTQPTESSFLQTSNYASILKLSPAIGKAIIKMVDKIFHTYQIGKDFTELEFLGRQDPRFPTLKMSECYIDIAYVESSELKSKEKLFNKEKESTFFKRQFHGGSFHQEYLTANVINEFKKIIIIGNPGVGKTTYAKWLCFEWAQNKVASHKIFLYLPLRKLPRLKRGRILQYLLKTFLPGQEINSVEMGSYFRTFSEDYLLILDGFDELSELDQSQILAEAEQTFPLSSFILLTRPYALLNTPLQWEGVLEIIGFNATTSNQYIDQAFATLSDIDRTADELKKIIHINPILKGLSDTPLLLSYIFFLYLELSNPWLQLIGIDSIYKLQELFHFAYEKYYREKKLRKKSKIKNLAQTSRSAEELAWELEKERKWIYYPDIGDTRLELCEDINKLGLGRLEPANDPIFPWRFYFLTLPIQEFLAARAIGKRIGWECLHQLIQNPEKWNLVRMIAGYWIANKQTNLINLIFQKLSHNYDTTGKLYYKYINLLLLAELDQDSLSNSLDQNQLREILNLYIIISENEYWKSLLVEAISRVHIKLPRETQSLFTSMLADILLDEIKANLESFTYLVPVVTSLMDLGKKIDLLKQDDSLLRILKSIQLIDKQIQHWDYLRFEKEDYTFEDQSHQAMGLALFLTDCLQFIPSLTLTRLKAPLTKLYEQINDINISKYLNGYLAQVEDADVAMEAFLRVEQEIRTLVESHTEQTEWEAHFQKHWVEDLKVLKVAHSLKGSSTETRKKTGERILNLFDQLILMANREERPINWQFTLISWGNSVSNALNILGLNHFLPKIYAILAEFDLHADPPMKINDPIFFENYYIGLLHSSLQKSYNYKWEDLVTILEAITCLESTLGGEYLFSRDRKLWYQLFVRLIEQRPNFDGNVDLISKCIQRISHLTSFPYDKKYFLKRLITSEKYKNVYVSENSIPEILQADFNSPDRKSIVFTEKIYWDFISEWLDEPNTLRMYTAVLDNFRLYQYEMNLPFLLKIQLKFYDWIEAIENDEIKKENLIFHYDFLTNMLNGIKSNPKISQRINLQNFYARLAVFLKLGQLNPWPSSVYNDTRQFRKLLLIFTLLFHLKPTLFNTKWSIFSSFPAPNSKVIQKFVLDLHKNFSSEELSKFQSTLGPEVEAKIHQYQQKFGGLSGTNSDLTLCSK